MKKILLILSLLIPQLLMGQATGKIISNKPSGGTIITDTLNLSTLFNLHQTTAGQTITVGSLSSGGKIIYLRNIGSVPVTLSPGGLLPVGKTTVMGWTGSAWSTTLSSGNGTYALVGDLSNYIPKSGVTTGDIDIAATESVRIRATDGGGTVTTESENIYMLVDGTYDEAWEELTPSYAAIGYGLDALQINTSEISLTSNGGRDIELTTNGGGDISLSSSTISIGTISGTTIGGPTIFNSLTASTVPYLDASKVLTSSAVTPTQLGYIDATSSIQTQLNSKQASLVSGTNIKTVNGSSLLGSGNISLGTVTDVSVVSANGISGSVATSTSTPAITLSLGAITPTTVNGLTLSGTGGSTVSFGTGGTVLYNGGALGTPSSGTLTNCTGLPLSTGITGFAANVITFLGTPSSSNLISAVTDETGSGSLVFATSPTLVTPLLGTPTSGTLTNCTGLPVSSGISGLGSGAASFLATPSSANLITLITDETGTGSSVFSTTPTLVTPVLGVATATSINKVAITAPATSATLTIANGKTLTASNTLTLTGTDASSVAFGAGGTVLYTTGISDVAYAGTWNGVTTIAPSKNAVYDKVQTLLPKTGGQMSGDITLVDGIAILFSPSGNQGSLQNDSTGLAINLTATNGLNLDAGGVILIQSETDDVIVSAASGGDLIMVGDTTEIDGAIFLGTNSAGFIKIGSPTSASISIYGNYDGSNAASGYVGQRIKQSQSSYTNYTTTATYQNVASITLTPGDWDISAQMTYSSNSATLTAGSNAIFAISTTTASAAGAVEYESMAFIPQSGLLGTSKFSESISPYQVNIASTTTYYLNTQATFTLGNPQFVGTIRAVRVR